MAHSLASSRTGNESERGVALVLTLIFAILLYILVAELVVSGRMVRATGENDALLARMRNQMLYQLVEAQDQLLTDLQGAAAAGEGGAGGMPGMGMPGMGEGGGAMPGEGGAAGGAEGGAGGEGEEEEPDPSTICDSSRDPWFHPIGAADNDITTYTWVEDENRKFNLLALWSTDEEFAEFSRDRLVRLLDVLREDTEFDVPMSDAQMIVSELTDWVRRQDTEAIPRPRLKTDDPNQDITIPLHLDELLMLPSVKEELFYDFVIDGKVYLGLESVLTIWTSIAIDPGNPEKVQQQRLEAQARGEQGPPVPGGGEEGGEAGGAGAPGGAGGTEGGGPGAEGNGMPTEPYGEGIKININTATYPVLRALFPRDKIPDRVLLAILRYRNEIDEEAMESELEEAPATQLSDFGNMQLGSEQKLRFFETTADLENVEEFADLPDPEIKADFQAALTTTSEVFSIHLASMHKRSEENRVYVLRRARAIVLRMDDGADGKIVPLVPFEERTGLRVQPVDLQEEQVMDLATVYMDMDQFAQEDRAWNPYLVDFYLPKYQRDEFYTPR
ncbi:MAG: general secretion pathway protein GspK [bacterium]|nr:general secretion pathway protein GspK [bacterium]